MQRIVVADIFGYTPAQEALVDRLPGDIDIIDPYEGHHLSFVSEADAYAFFISEGGLDRYTELLSSRIEKFKSPVSLLGFSVGASAIWRLSNQGIIPIAFSNYCITAH
ncbi:hypothetical protein [Endozoicomonas atrinae]|uniref:hypothetical protein n=1 Tax=Endozoicomonas atrinae TaxID=1333660 RepID=UPI0008250A60|nr:hypothetical protein [Endozoicomonas atrinae]